MTVHTGINKKKENPFNILSSITHFSRPEGRPFSQWRFFHLFIHSCCLDDSRYVF